MPHRQIEDSVYQCWNPHGMKIAVGIMIDGNLRIRGASEFYDLSILSRIGRNAGWEILFLEKIGL
jgi:hypothetical protein